MSGIHSKYFRGPELGGSASQGPAPHSAEAARGDTEVKGGGGGSDEAGASDEDDTGGGGAALVQIRRKEKDFMKKSPRQKYQ